MNRTPNTPANGGQIQQWHQRTDKMDDASIIAALKSEVADLRASLAAPAIPTVDRNTVLGEAAALCSSAAAFYDESAREQGIDPETKNVRKILRDECDSLKLAIRALKSVEPVAQPAAQVAVSGMHEAANFIDAKAEKYLQDHADTEHDTGATVFHYREAGREYHSMLVELAEELREQAAPSIKHMVDRFLGWKLPDDFYPDAGISFKAPQHPFGWPTGTNLFHAGQAKAMFEYVIATPATVKTAEPE